MNKKGEISVRKAWLIVLVSLIDDMVVLAFIFLGLWLFHVEITWLVILIVLVAIVIFILVMHKAVIPAIRRRKISGAEGMIGATGEVTQPLKPKGIVKIKDEYWNAVSIAGDIESGGEVEVVGIKGLNLEVKKKVDGSS
jgi:membrane-bound ClpP family serine protease